MFRQNFGYTVAILEVMIADLTSTGRSSTFDAICGRHFTDFTYLARGGGIPMAWEEDCTCEGLMHIQAALIRGGFQFNQENSDIRNWFTRVYKNFTITYKRKLDRAATDEFDPNLLGDLMDESDYEWKEHLLTQLNIAFTALCADCKYILTAYYWEKRTYKSLAEEFNMIDNNMNQKAKRCRETLKNALKKLL